MIFRLTSLALAAFALLLISCGNGDEEIKKMNFQVDEDSLGESLIDETLGVRFRAPVGQIAIEGENLVNVKRSVGSGDLGPYTIEPRLVFIDSTDYSTTVVNLVTPKSPTEEPLTDFHNFILSVYDSSTAHPTEFMRKELRMTQYVIRDGGQIDVKIAFEAKDGNLAVVDYILNADSYTRLAPAIESSIGDIKLLFVEED